VKTLLTICIVGLFLFLGCETQIEKTDIGYMGTLSGRYSDLGQATLQGVMLAIEDSGNADKVNLIVKDDYGKADESIKALSDLKSSGVKYIIGPNLSSVATAVVPMLEAQNMFMLSPTTSTSSLAGLRDNFLRTMPHNNYKQAELTAKYILEKLKIKSVVVLYDSRNASYSNDIVRKFTEAYMRVGGELNAVRSFNPDSGTSLGSLLEDDKDSPPDMYYIIGSSIDTSLLIWQIKKAGFNSEILIRKWAASNEFYRLGGEAVEGVKVFDYYIDETTDAYQDFEMKYKERFQKSPSWMSMYGYEATRILVESLPDLKEGKDFNTALGISAKKNKLLINFEFDEFWDAFLPLHFFEIHKGETVHKGMVE